MDNNAPIEVVELSRVGEVVNQQLQELMKALQPIESDEKEAVMAQAKAGLFDEMANFRIVDMPIGQAVAGGVGALFVSAGIDYAMKPVREKIGTRWGDTILKGTAAYATNRWLKGYIGKNVSTAAVLFLLWEAFESALPEVTSWFHNILPASTPTGITTSPVRNPAPVQLMTIQPALSQANYPQIVARYG